MRKAKIWLVKCTARAVIQKTCTVKINGFNINNTDEGTWNRNDREIDCTWRVQQQTINSKHARNIQPS
jgi:hypothetical protein